MLYREGQIIGVSRIQWDPRGTDEDPKCLFSDHKKNRIEIRPLYEIKKGIFIFQIGRHKNHNLKPKFVDFGLNFVHDKNNFNNPLLQVGSGSNENSNGSGCGGLNSTDPSGSSSLVVTYVILRPIPLMLLPPP